MDHSEISNPSSQNVVLHKYVCRSIESLDTIDFESTNSLKTSKSFSYNLNTLSNEEKLNDENEDLEEKGEDLEVRGRRSSRPLEFATEQPCSTPKNSSSLGGTFTKALIKVFRSRSSSPHVSKNSSSTESVAKSGPSKPSKLLLSHNGNSISRDTTLDSLGSQSFEDTGVVTSPVTPLSSKKTKYLNTGHLWSRRKRSVSSGDISNDVKNENEQKIRSFSYMNHDKNDQTPSPEMGIASLFATHLMTSKFEDKSISLESEYRFSHLPKVLVNSDECFDNTMNICDNDSGNFSGFHVNCDDVDVDIDNSDIKKTAKKKGVCSDMNINGDSASNSSEDDPSENEAHSQKLHIPRLFKRLSLRRGSRSDDGSSPKRFFRPRSLSHSNIMSKENLFQNNSVPQYKRTNSPVQCICPKNLDDNFPSEEDCTCGAYDKKSRSLDNQSPPKLLFRDKSSRLKKERKESDSLDGPSCQNIVKGGRSFGDTLGKMAEVCYIFFGNLFYLKELLNPVFK